MQKDQQLPWLCWLPLFFLTLPVSIEAQESCNPVAQIVSAQGQIRLNGNMLDNGTAVRKQTNICVGDLISAGELSRAAITILNSDAVVRIDQNTELRINFEEIADPSFLELFKGAINILSPAPLELGVKTPFVNAAVEGTEFSVRVEPDQATVTVLDGVVSVTDSNGQNEVSLQENQAASATRGQAPRIDASVDANNVGTAVQWAHFYPPVIDDQKTIAGLGKNDPLFHVRRAARALSAGGVDEAEIALSAATALDANNEDVWALNLIIALAQFDRTAAKAAAIERYLREAEQRSFSSTAALIALSYAQQWEFNLSGALGSLEAADRIDPNNSLVLARLAELWLSLGDTDTALSFAEKANSTSSNARALTVLGFAYLAQTKIADAEAAFTDAVEQNSSDPLTHLGSGLVKIRQGDLAGGREKILIAASQDQGNALVRSYLGKTYYEEKLGPLDSKQYSIAKKLDPNDPTPWFYDAIRLQTTNQPVAALHELQESIDKNDNRAVYRSRLLLDEDLAARSASLGRIYRDLGFEQLALLEGWKSVNKELSNYSGHRLLADAYSSLPRHQIARANELYQSQLLQPSNVTPIQPQLAEANLFILDSAGPSELAFNEFNPLFSRERAALQASAVVGGNDTLGDDIVIFGMLDRWSYSFGQFHFTTDGFRENNDLEQNILNAFVQFRPSFKTSLQAEVRSTDTEKGDLALRFDPANFFSSQRAEENVESLRLGLRHTFTTRSELIGSIVYQDADGALSLPPFLSVDIELQGLRVEGQHLYNGDRFGIVSGVSHLENDLGEVQNLSIPVPFPPFVLESTERIESDIRHTSAYVYSQIELSKRATLTVGASADSLTGRTVDRDEIYPKAGILWQPSQRTTLRAAAFKTIQRPFISKQSIQPSLEPTQIAGFNQFFFGSEGEEVWRYGLGIDHRFSERLSAGAEVSKRDVETPALFTGPIPEVIVFDVEEKLGRAYFYWTALQKLAISTDYQYERIDNNGQVFDNATTIVTTHRFSLRMSYFSINGISAWVKAAYIRQKGQFQDLTTNLVSPGEDEFSLVDASIRYRLPKRKGLVSLTINNIFDTDFRFQDSDPENPNILPETWALLNVTLAFGN